MTNPFSIFGNNYTYIYLVELEFKNENECNCRALLLDLSIEVHYRKFTSKLFDKRDALLFYMNHKACLDGNVPYDSVHSEILRFARRTVWLQWQHTQSFDDTDKIGS